MLLARPIGPSFVTLSQRPPRGVARSIDFRPFSPMMDRLLFRTAVTTFHLRSVIQRPPGSLFFDVSQRVTCSSLAVNNAGSTGRRAGTLGGSCFVRGSTPRSLPGDTWMTYGWKLIASEWLIVCELGRINSDTNNFVHLLGTSLVPRYISFLEVRRGSGDFLATLWCTILLAQLRGRVPSVWNCS